LREAQDAGWKPAIQRPEISWTGIGNPKSQSSQPAGKTGKQPDTESLSTLINLIWYGST